MAITTTIGVGGEHARKRIEESLAGNRVDVAGQGFRGVLIIGLGIAIAFLGVVLYDVLFDGVGFISERGTSFFSETVRRTDVETGIFEGIRGTFWIGVFVTVFSFPTGIAAAIYLEEYATPNKITRAIELNIRNLAGVPSIVYGVLGLSIFVNRLDGFFPSVVDRTLGQTTAAAGATLCVLVLPIVIITASEAVRAVPQPLREAGFGVGATKSEVIRHHVLPYAAPGILTGTLLSLARALGEAAPLILVGAVTGRLGARSGLLDTDQLGERFTALPIQITEFATRPGGRWDEVTAAAIVTLLGVVILANTAAILLRNRFEKKREA